MITRLDKVTVYVQSQEEAKKFWTEQAGFVVCFEQEMAPGMTWLEVSPASDSLTSLVLYSKEAMLQQNPKMVSHPGIIFATDNADATWQALKDKGVQVEEIQRMPYGTMFSFSDPDGNPYMVRSQA